MLVRPNEESTALGNFPDGCPVPVDVPNVIADGGMGDRHPVDGFDGSFPLARVAPRNQGERVRADEIERRDPLVLVFEPRVWEARSRAA